MQGNTKRRGAILSAAIVIGFFVLYLALIAFSVLSESFGDVVGILFLLIFALIIAAVIWGVAAALRQRLRELDSGEEEDARQY